MKLSDVRVDIDKIDNAMKELFIRRMELSESVADIKIAEDDKVYKPDREKAMTEKLTADVNENIKGEYASFLETVVRLSRKHQYSRINDAKNLKDASGNRICIKAGGDDIIRICRMVGDYGAEVENTGFDDNAGLVVLYIRVNNMSDAGNLMLQLESETDACIFCE